MDAKLLAAGAMIEKDGKFLMVQEAKPHVYGLWNWPAGHLEEGETFEEGAAREIKEETGFDVEIGKEIGEWPGDDNPQKRKKLFLAKIVGGELKVLEGELLDVAWYTEEEIRAMSDKLRSRWVLEGLDILNKRNAS